MINLPEHISQELIPPPGPYEPIPAVLGAGGVLPRARQGL